MICETEKRLLPGAACAVLFVHGILGSPAQFAPFLPLGKTAIGQIMRRTIVGERHAAPGDALTIRTGYR